MKDQLLIESLQKDLGITLKKDDRFENIRASLVAHISTLINSDFNQLVSLLYRIDVNEGKLRTVLHDTPGQDAAELITDMIIDRQLQKLQSRKDSTNNDKIADDERW